MVKDIMKLKQISLSLFAAFMLSTTALAQCPDSITCADSIFQFHYSNLPNSGSLDSLEVMIDPSKYGIAIDSIVGNSFYITTTAFNCSDVSDKLTYYKNHKKVGKKCYDNTPLPVKFIDYSATLVDGSIKVKWSTAMESNNRGFYVLKYDGMVFNQIGFVTGAGNSNSINEYRFADSDIKGGYNYYQIKQIDYDGAMDLSNVFYLKIQLVDSVGLASEFDLLGRRVNSNKI